jgi:hypothetical protein
MVHPICVFMRSRIRDFLGERGESLRWLSKQTKVDYQKLYRLDSNELKSFSFFEARRVLKFIAPENYLALLREFYPEEMRDLTDLSLSESDQESQIEAVKAVISSKHHYELYLFAAETPGADRSLIEKYYGLKGIEVLEWLVSKGALKSAADGSYIGVLRGLLAPPEEIVKSICETHIEMIDLGTPGSFGANHGRGLNLEGRKRAYEAISRTWHELYKIFESPECQGNEISVFSLFLGSLTGGHK